MTNNNGEIGMSGPYVIDAKPHGHGDVHALMHSSGTATEWMDAGMSITHPATHPLTHPLTCFNIQSHILPHVI